MAGMLVAATAAGQPMPARPPVVSGSPPPVLPAPGILVPPRASPEEAAAFRRKMDEYMRCTRENDRGMRLAETSRGIVSMRDGRAFWEGELLRNASLQQRYPQGYGQMLDEAFRLYRSQGGTASSLAAVTAVPPPCTNPWDTYRSKGAPLSQSRSMSIPAPPR